jgi:hypothetical protein
MDSEKGHGKPSCQGCGHHGLPLLGLCLRALINTNVSVFSEDLQRSYLLSLPSLIPCMRELPTPRTFALEEALRAEVPAPEVSCQIELWVMDTIPDY